VPFRIARTGNMSLRAIGAAVVAGLLGVAWLAPGALVTLRLAWFDGYQRLAPRNRIGYPVTIVAIDEASLRRHGHWPWPRDRLAALVHGIAAHAPAVIGLDIVMPEADRNSPEMIAAELAATEPRIAAELRRLPAHDAQLAAALMTAPTVLGVALVDDERVRAGRAPVSPSPEGAHAARIPAYSHSLHSIGTIEAAATAVAALNAEPERGIIRRMPGVLSAGGRIWPGFAFELLRVASGADRLALTGDVHGLISVGIADRTVPLDRDGRMWVHFAESDPRRLLSAAAVIDGTVDPDAISGHVVLVGFTALGLLDVVTTPLGERRPGVEVHAEVIENIFDDRLLWRPHWAAALEALAFVLIAALALAGCPYTRPWRAVSLFAAGSAALAAAGYAAFRAGGLLFDAASPVAGAALLFVALLALSLIDAERHRRRLAATLAAEREAQARMLGELAAAHRIQTGLLPDPGTVLGADPRARIAATMQPARSVGGDLYDFFLLDANHLFVGIGDVSGKGVPASLFMTLAKSLTKSSALRDAAPLDAKIRRAHEEIARDNPESLFVTLCALVLDLESGAIELVNAGHEPPLVLGASGVEPMRGEPGPPLCVIDAYDYPITRTGLQRGDLLVLLTDGVTEATDPAGALYGRERLAACLAAQRGNPAPEQIIAAVRADVERHAAGIELPDDVAMVAVRWNGPAA
jgi:serine phosphatase RsbU (regulator of sigma subunit)